MADSELFERGPHWVSSLTVTNVTHDCYRQPAPGPAAEAGA